MVKTRKRILSVIMSVAMVLTAVPFGMFGTAVVVSGEETPATFVNDADGKVVLPYARLTSTSTIRTANATYHMQLGNTIVKATPSGIAEVSSNDYPTDDAGKNGYYAGETPVSPQIVLTSDYKLDNPTITCLNNTSVTFSSVTKSEPSVGSCTYTWEITGGTVDSGQKSLNFQVGYGFTYFSLLLNKNITKSYVSYCTSAVEQASQPGGMYAFRTRTGTSHTNDHAGFIVRLVGANTFGSFYKYSDNEDSNSYWDFGYAKFTGYSGLDSDDGFHRISKKSNGAVGYGTVRMTRPKHSGDGNVTTNTGLDEHRPVSTLYVDSSYSSLLQSYNARIAIMPLCTRDTDAHFYKLRSIRALSGEQEYNTDSADANAFSQLGLSESASSEQALTTFANYNVPFTGSSYTNSASKLDNGNYMSSYTVITYAGVDHNYNTKCDGEQEWRVNNMYVGVDLRIISYDKSEIRGAVDDVYAQYAPTKPLASESEVGNNPNPQFYKDSTAFNAYLSALQSAQYVLADPDTDQNTINSTAEAFNTAITGLNGKVAEANYSSVDAAKARARSLDASLYTDASWNNLLNVVNSVKTGYSVFYQTAVDKMAIDINAAIDALEDADADFSVINQLMDRFSSENSNDYTLETWTVLQNAVNSYTNARAEYITQNGHDYTVSDQVTVDGYAAAIADAFDKLQYSSADYTEVNRYAAAYEALIPNKDMYDSMQWAAATAAYNALANVRNLNWKKQSEVDTAANNLKAALDALGYKLADYSAVDAAVRVANSRNKAWYTNSSWQNLQEKIDAVVEGLDLTHQSEVDKMASDINSAIDALVDVLADYSAIYALESEYQTLKAEDIYTDESLALVQAEFDKVDYTIVAREQKTVDGYAKNIRTALDAVEEKPANYTAVNNLIDAWGQINKDYYTNASVVAVQSAINSVKWNLKITNQSVVDGYASAIDAAIKALKYKKADYSAVLTAIANERTKVNAQTSFQIAHKGYSLYEAESYNEMLAKVNTVVYDLDISKQTQVDGYAEAINTAVSNLKYNTADYSAVTAAINKVPADIETNDDYDVLSAAEVLNAVGNVSYNYTTEKQSLVDQFAADIETAVANLKYKTADYSAVDDLIDQWSKYPDKDKYTAASVSAVDGAIAAVVRGYSIFDQDKVTAMANKIQSAIDALDVDVADYSAVNTAVINANKLLENEKLYTEATVTALKAEIGKVDYTLKSEFQSTVDGYAQSINSAAAALKYNPLDRTNYDIVIAKVPSKTNIYTADSVKAMNDAKAAANAMLTNHNEIIYQNDFDALVNNLDAKIAALKVVYADYTKVDEAVAAANALVKEYYADFSGVENALAAIEQNRNLDISQQTAVNNLAKALNNAINSLVMLDADYSEVEKAKNSVPEDLTVYTDESVEAVQTAVKNVVSNLKIDRQADVDLFAAAINDAVKALKYKSADYTELDALVASVSKMKSSDYKNWNDIYWTYIYSYVNDYIPANRGFDSSKQADVDAMTNTLQGYIDMLLPSGADYTFVYIMIDEAEAAIDTGIYTDKSVSALQGVIDSIDYTYSRLEQSKVDMYVYAINDAIEALVEKPSDFSKIDELYNWFMNLNSRNYKNYTDVKWDYVWPYYNNDVASAKLKYTKISQQSKVDKMYDVLKSYCDMLIAPVFEAKEGSTTVIEVVDGNKYIVGTGSGVSEKELIDNYVAFENVVVEVEKSENSAFYLGTGTVVNVYVMQGNKKVLFEQYTLVVYGDIDGNGVVDAFDMLQVSAIASGSMDAKDAASIKSCDFDNNGMVDANDLINIARVTSGCADINQQTGKIA